MSSQSLQTKVCNDEGIKTPNNLKTLKTYFSGSSVFQLLHFVWFSGSLLAYATPLSVAAVAIFQTKDLPTLPPLLREHIAIDLSFVTYILIKLFTHL